MDNNNNNNQVNNPDVKPPIAPPTDKPVEPKEQNNNGGNPNPQEPYTTYSSIPNIFNHNPAVSQNRNIPPRPMPNGGQQNRPNMPNGGQQARPNMPNNGQQVRPNMPNAGQQVRPNMPNGGQQVRPNMPNNGQQVRPNMPNAGQQARQPMQNSTPQQPKRPSEGRAFAEEFYSKPSANSVNPVIKPTQPVTNDKPAVNPMVKPTQPVANDKPAVNPMVKPTQPVANDKPAVNPMVKPTQPVANDKPVVNPVIKPTQPVGYTKPLDSSTSKPINTTPEINKQANPQSIPNSPYGNNSIDDDTVNTPKRDIKYNYQALTPPDKKSTSIIIFVYIVVIVMLLVGLIGYAISIGGSTGFKESYSDLFSKFNLEDVFADDDSDVKYPDLSDSDFDNNVYSHEFTYINKYSTEKNVTVYSAPGYEYDSSLSQSNFAVFTDPDTGVSFQAWIASGNTDNIDELFTNIINPDNEDYSANNTVEYYQTFDLEAYIEKIEFNDREQLFAFAELEDNVLLVICATKDLTTEYNEAVDEDTILASLEQMLDRVSLY